MPASWLQNYLHTIKTSNKTQNRNVVGYNLLSLRIFDFGQKNNVSIYSQYDNYSAQSGWKRMKIRKLTNSPF